MKVLSIDGGGIRGLVSCRILDLVDENIEKYDVFCGVSTGSMIACALADGYTPSEIRKLYNSHAKQVFGKGIKHWINRIYRMIRHLDPSVAKYDVAPLKKLLQNVFGDKKFKDLNKRVFVLTYNMSRDYPILLDNRNILYEDLTIVDVCLMSASAPTYFDPYEVDGEFYIDGSVIATRMAYLCVGIIDTIAEVTEIGTGLYSPSNPKNVDPKMGTIDWINEIVDVFLNSSKLNSYLLYLSKTIQFTRHDALLKTNIKIDASDDDSLKALNCITEVDMITLSNVDTVQPK
jgi:hypothetical protein